jgi:type II secretory pathway component GspD/PulD (secretin)
MRLILLLSFLSLFVGLHPFAAEEPKGRLNIKDFDVQHVLPFYKDISGLELVIDSRVKTVRSSVTLQISEPLPKAQAVTLLEKALLEQAGVVITRLEGERASVTYNDALPLVAAKKQSKQ